MPLQLAHGNLVGGTVGGGDEVGYGFCLGEVEFAVEVGTLGEFARVGLATTLLREAGEDLLSDVRRAMERDFSRVLTCVGVGGTENGDKNVVNDLPFVVGDDTMMKCIRTGILNWLGKHFAEDAEGVGTRDSDDGNGSACGGGNGADGVVGLGHISGGLMWGGLRPRRSIENVKKVV